MSVTLLAALAFLSPLDDGPPLPSSEFTEQGHTKDKLAIVKERVIAKKAILLDVREKNEWDAGHLKHARFLPLSDVRKGKLTREQQKYLPKGKPIYLHCKSGGRVLAVCNLLKDKGYDIRPLKAGYAVLVKEGFEKAKPAKVKP